MVTQGGNSCGCHRPNCLNISLISQNDGVWPEETICNICGCHRLNCISTFLLSHRTMRVDQKRRFADFVQVFTVNKKATCSIVHIDCLRKATKLLLGWKKLISLGSCSIVYLFWTDKLYHTCNASRDFSFLDKQGSRITAATALAGSTVSPSLPLP